MSHSLTIYVIMYLQYIHHLYTILVTMYINLAAPARGHTGKTEDVNTQAGSTPSAGISSQGDRKGSFGSDISDNTLIQAELSARTAHSRRSSDCYNEQGPPLHPTPESGSHPSLFNGSHETRGPHEYSGTVSPVDLTPTSSSSSSIPYHATSSNEYQALYTSATDHTDQTRFNQINSHQLGSDFVPAYGKDKIEGPALNIYARIMIALPGDPITKALTNPLVCQSFRLHIPNNFAVPFFKDRQFLTHLINTAKAILEVSFPFPFFDLAHLKYILEADSIFFTYKMANQYFFHRINVTQLRAMDPAMRDEWLDHNTPQPTQFICSNGSVFDANYDIVILAHNIKPKQLHNAQSHNEGLLLMGINHLITERIDAVGTVAKVLSLYHDYRLSIMKAPARFPRDNQEHLPPPHPSEYHPANTNMPPQPVPPPVVIQPEARQARHKVNMMYIPPYRRGTQSQSSEEVHPQHTVSQERTYNEQMQLMKNNYTSPYEPDYEDVCNRTQENIRAAKKRTRNKIVDPTTPWARTAEIGTKS